MTDKADPKAPVPAGFLPFSDLASAHAPFLYFEDVPTFGLLNGIVRVTLEASRLYSVSPQDGATADRVVVAHLRMSIPAALSLKAAIEGALLLAAQAHSDARN